MKILVLNAGSSSQKCHLYEIARDQLPTTPSSPLWAAEADWGGQKGEVSLTVKAHGQSKSSTLSAGERGEIIEQLLQTLWHGQTAVVRHPSQIDMVGHRVVHGGPTYQESVLITPQVVKDIRSLSSFAPLHNPANLEGILATEHLLGQTPQIAVFDTAYHSHLPPVAQVYPGPYSWYEQGIRRYGFHGISHQYCARRSAQLLARDFSGLRIVSCHLGNGCSLAAVRDGKSIDTTMGFTPLEGLMMGSRSGSIDPGILPYLQRLYGYSPDKLDHILNKESGLKGISGLSSDMREIMQAIEQGNARAQLALDLFVYRLRLFVGAMIAALEGVDVLSFTGGIGENAPVVRTQVCDAFKFLGFQLDEAKNNAEPLDQDIATASSSIRILVLHTQEDWEIACECWRLKGSATDRGGSVS